MYFLRGNTSNITYDDFNYTEVNYTDNNITYYDNNIIPWSNLSDWFLSWFL